MATKRTPVSRTPVGRRSATLERYLLYGQLPEAPGEPDALDPWIFTPDDWPSVRDEVISAWIADRPGSRPFGWWRFDSKVDRLKVRGSGTEGAVLHIFGRVCGYFDCDPTDPPVIESEAAYLARIGELTAAERKRLRPAAFRPVALEVEDEDEALPEELRKEFGGLWSLPPDTPDGRSRAHRAA